MTKPITPDDVTLKKAELIPDGVIEAFNQLIAEHWNGKRSSFTLGQAYARAEQILGYKPKSHHMDVEPIYRANGWSVKYDSPGYNETGPATFTFARKK